MGKSDGSRNACRASFGGDTSCWFEDRTAGRRLEDPIQIVCHTSGVPGTGQASHIGGGEDTRGTLERRQMEITRC